MGFTVSTQRVIDERIVLSPCPPSIFSIAPPFSRPDHSLSYFGTPPQHRSEVTLISPSPSRHSFRFVFLGLQARRNSSYLIPLCNHAARRASSHGLHLVWADGPHDKRAWELGLHGAVDRAHRTWTSPLVLDGASSFTRCRILTSHPTGSSTHTLEIVVGVHQNSPHEEVLSSCSAVDPLLEQNYTSFVTNTEPTV